MQSATIQPQSSVLKEKPPYRERVQQCSSLQSCNSQERPSHHRTAAPELGIVEQTSASAQGLSRTSCPSRMPSDLSNKTGPEPKQQQVRPRDPTMSTSHSIACIYQWALTAKAADAGPEFLIPSALSSTLQFNVLYLASVCARYLNDPEAWPQRYRLPQGITKPLTQGIYRMRS